MFANCGGLICEFNVPMQGINVIIIHNSPKFQRQKPSADSSADKNYDKRLFITVVSGR
ncbi:hypothetical protein VCRA2119O51_10176 [Vibrio crassostreae]|nr:hypothetical protein VCHA42O253_40111 [Vibrio chagasii]CAK1862255.1 hypothetical protein VCRA2116O31_10176 [Vibrio crassostreae]CAK2311311.1 hypothetical protein VCRA2119O51_10176 [Vibrio crassostreae]